MRAPGDFAIRGGVTDVFPPGAKEPIRFDFFGDQLESLRAFDPETQRSTQQLKRIDLTPVSEVLLDDDSVRRFRAKFVDNFGVGSDQMYEAVTAHIRRQGVEQWLPYFYERLETVFDYAGAAALIGFEHLAEDSCKERYDQAKEHFEARRSAPMIRGASPFRGPAPEQLYLSPEALVAELAPLRVRRFTPFDEAGRDRIDLSAKPGRTFAAERAMADVNVFEIAAQHVRALAKAGKRVVLAAWTEGSAERLAGVMADHGLKDVKAVAAWSNALPLKASDIALAVLPLEHGFEGGGRRCSL